MRLKAEIAAILVVKIILLATLRAIFFRGAEVTLDAASVAQHTLPSDAQAAATRNADDH